MYYQNIHLVYYNRISCYSNHFSTKLSQFYYDDTEQEHTQLLLLYFVYCDLNNKESNMVSKVEKEAYDKKSMDIPSNLGFIW